MEKDRLFLVYSVQSWKPEFWFTRRLKVHGNDWSSLVRCYHVIEKAVRCS